MSDNEKIIITSQVVYLPDQSVSSKRRFMWSYDITIENGTDQLVQLLNRHWIITEMSGKKEEIQGPGVIGLQPVIKAGRRFTYTSYCQLTTPQGTMEGHYEMQLLPEFKHFVVEIPKFILSSPDSIPPSFRSQLH